MNAHTPGHWVVNGKQSVRGRLGEYIARTTGINGEANARLIAAAPDLLTQCQRALDAWTGDGPGARLDEMRAAIAKATGGAL